MIKVGIIGANGYTGFELLRLLSAHKNAKVVLAASRSFKGTKVTALYPALSPFYDELYFTEPDATAAAKTCDVVFCALPHGVSAEFIKQIAALNTKVIDLSADFRYDDIDLYEKTYKVTHPAKELNKQAIYGLTELFRDDVKKAQVVANPGCYTTASILGLYPLLKEKAVLNDDIIIDAKSGTSGAGRKDDAAYGFCEVDGSFKAYGVTTHRHTSEIEEKLSFDGHKMALSFTPHLLPVKRGILATIYAKVSGGITDKTEKDITDIYNKYYGKEQFVSVLSNGGLPEINSVAGSNMCKIGFKLDKKLNRIIIVSCIDNLIKGASGQAIQNMNVMFGFSENEGLNRAAFHM